jgi:hypothetical protein
MIGPKLRAALDEDEAMAMEVDDDEVPTQGKRKINTHNKELYDQFTSEDMDKADDKKGRLHGACQHHMYQPG